MDPSEALKHLLEVYSDSKTTEAINVLSQDIEKSMELDDFMKLPFNGFACQIINKAQIPSIEKSQLKNTFIKREESGESGKSQENKISLKDRVMSAPRLLPETLDAGDIESDDESVSSGIPIDKKENYSVEDLRSLYLKGKICNRCRKYRNIIFKLEADLKEFRYSQEEGQLDYDYVKKINSLKEELKTYKRAFKLNNVKNQEIGLPSDNAKLVDILKTILQEQKREIIRLTNASENSPGKESEEKRLREQLMKEKKKNFHKTKLEDFSVNRFKDIRSQKIFDQTCAGFLAQNAVLGSHLITQQKAIQFAAGVETKGGKVTIKLQLPTKAIAVEFKGQTADVKVEVFSPYNSLSRHEIEYFGLTEPSNPKDSVWVDVSRGSLPLTGPDGVCLVLFQEATPIFCQMRISGAVTDPEIHGAYFATQSKE